MQQPLAVADENSIGEEDKFLYELRFPDRTGENYSLNAESASSHKWYYYPQMEKDECLIFKVYDKKLDGPRFVFHTAFEDPMSPPDPPPRKSIEVRTICFWDDDQNVGPPAQKPIFFDMKHSNNAARIRLWLRMNSFNGSLPSSEIDRTVVEYADLKTPSFKKTNPLAKVPSFVRPDGEPVYESAVILQYLEDKYGPFFDPGGAESRQLVNWQIRMHDLYVASPNCTQPGFSHSQGAMYLSASWHGPERGMSLEDRAAKFAELWKQLCLLEGSVRDGGGYLAGPEVTLSDMTWHPTAVFMEHMLPKFGWPDIFGPGSPFPKLSSWYRRCLRYPAFAETRGEILEYWEEMGAKGQFEPILKEIEEAPACLKFKYP